MPDPREAHVCLGPIPEMCATPGACIAGEQLRGGDTHCLQSSCWRPDPAPARGVFVCPLRSVPRLPGMGRQSIALKALSPGGTDRFSADFTALPVGLSTALWTSSSATSSWQGEESRVPGPQGSGSPKRHSSPNPAARQSDRGNRLPAHEREIFQFQASSRGGCRKEPRPAHPSPIAGPRELPNRESSSITEGTSAPSPTSPAPMCSFESGLYRTPEIGLRPW